MITKKNLTKFLILLIFFYAGLLSGHTIGKKRHHNLFYRVFHPRYRKYTLTLPSKDQNSGYLWYSLPVLDKKSRFIHFDPDVIEWAFSDILSPCDESGLKEMRMKPVGSFIHYMMFADTYWMDSDYELFSNEGYKISCEYDKPITIDFYGYKEDENKEMTLFPNMENWIGYFLEKELYPSEAFGEFWQYIISIKTQNWSWERGLNMNPDKYTLSFGDMVEVRTNKKISFRWNKAAKRRKKKKITLPKYFCYVEKFDYKSLFVYIAQPTKKPEEIGVFQNGVCVGAVSVNDSLLSLPIYLNEKITKSNDFDLIGYYPEFGERFFKYSLIEGNLHNKSFFVKIDGFTDKNKNLKLNVKKNSDENIEISYSLPNDGNIQLDIYNIKGQKVKTLVKGNQKAGYYKSVWTGKDDNGKKVSSGVYLYRLKTSNKVITRKMLMLK